MSSATGGTGTPSGLEAELLNALSGIQAVLPPGSGLSLGGQIVTQAQLVAEFEAAIAPYAAVRAERVVYLQKLKDRTAGHAATRERLSQFRSAAVAFFGAGSPLLAKFGFRPKTKQALTTGQKAMAAAKRSLTRKLRGTLGSKQKAAIKSEGAPVVSLSGGGVPQVTPSAADARALGSARANTGPNTGPAPAAGSTAASGGGNSGGGNTPAKA